MKHKTWFRLVLKAVGVLLIGMALPSAAGWVFQIVISVIDDRSGRGVGGANRWWWWLSSLGILAQLAFGLYLVFGGKWLVNKIIPSNRPYWPECGYDLSLAPGQACPECGVTLPEALRGE